MADFKPLPSPQAAIIQSSPGIAQSLHIMAKSNLTGFDPRKLAAAAGTPANDPWARREAWRYTGPFTRWNRFKNALPGLGWGTAAFVVYLGYEQFFASKSNSHGHH